MHNLPVAVTPLSMTWTIMSLLAGLSSINMATVGPRFSMTLCDGRSNRMASNQNNYDIKSSYEVHTVTPTMYFRAAIMIFV